MRHESDRSRSRLPLDRAQLLDLLAHLEQAVVQNGCDTTLAATHAWARHQGVDRDRLTRLLARFGGYCDCEVVMNVDPDDIV